MAAAVAVKDEMVVSVTKAEALEIMRKWDMLKEFGSKVYYKKVRKIFKRGYFFEGGVMYRIKPGMLCADEGKACEMFWWDCQHCQEQLMARTS